VLLDDAGAARVESMHCAAGDAIGAGQLLVTLQALDSAA
jgi:hypothetical protein